MKKLLLLLLISLFLIPLSYAEEGRYRIYSRKTGGFRKKTEQILLDTQTGTSWLYTKGQWQLIQKERSDEEISNNPKLPGDWAEQPKDIKKMKIKNDQELGTRAKQSEDIAAMAKKVAERNIRAKQANEIRAMMSQQAEEIKALKGKQDQEIKVLMGKQAQEINAEAIVDQEVAEVPATKQIESKKKETKNKKAVKPRFLKQAKKKSTAASVAEEKKETAPPAWF